MPNSWKRTLMPDLDANADISEQVYDLRGIYSVTATPLPDSDTRSCRIKSCPKKATVESLSVRQDVFSDNPGYRPRRMVWCQRHFEGYVEVKRPVGLARAEAKRRAWERLAERYPQEFIAYLHDEYRRIEGTT